MLVTCHPHHEAIAWFPRVRGHYLAKHLARAGLAAEFHELPVPGVRPTVVICSEYQQELDWLEQHLAAPLTALGAERTYCLADASLVDAPDHFSQPYCRWFAARGGVLCHLAGEDLLPYEHWIGIGVDGEVVRPDANGRRDQVVFDHPKRGTPPDPGALATIRARIPGLRLVGTGPDDTPDQDAYDEWIDYGLPHETYVRAVFAGAVAYVPGAHESMGLPITEAQVAGACVVSSIFQVKPELLVPSAKVGYEAGDADSLVVALAVAQARDGVEIREQALERFDFAAVAARTRAAIGL